MSELTAYLIPLLTVVPIPRTRSLLSHPEGESTLKNFPVKGHTFSYHLNLSILSGRKRLDSVHLFAVYACFSVLVWSDFLKRLWRRLDCLLAGQREMGNCIVCIFPAEQLYCVSH